MTARNHWEQTAMRKYSTVADVERELARCRCAQDATPRPARKRDWQARINFLNRLRTYRVTMSN